MLSLLSQAATSTSGVIAYRRGDHTTPVRISYQKLLKIATNKAAWLRRQPHFRPGAIHLIHFSQHLDNIVWFWATIIAESVPALSPPLGNTTEGRRAHFQHLWRVLEDPLVLTSRESLAGDFSENVTLRVLLVDESDEQKSTSVDKPSENRAANGHLHNNGYQTKDQLRDVAVVMLTSGSSGHSKAVCLSHQQILASIHGKLTVAPMPKDGAVLNWIGLDHVASLIEVHLLAMYTGVNQVQIQATEILTDPLCFLQLLSEHHISMTFAPNFFLARLLATLDKALEQDTKGVRLSHLKTLTSGGELNNVDTGTRITNHLRRLGVKSSNPIIPGFGMTEICAGGIFNRSFPDLDRNHLREFAVLGEPIPGLEMRISSLDHTHDQVGHLELCGPIIFSKYLNDEVTTKQSFTPDGWFRTGDLGKIDAQGQLHLAGRFKELININSVKYLPYEIEDAIEASRIPGITPSFIACFSYRKGTTSHETVFVVYQHDYAPDDIKARVASLHAIVRTVVLVTSSRPDVLPLPPGYLQKTSLGKLSRPKISSALLDGTYKVQRELNDKLLDEHRKENFTPPRNETETKLLSIFQQLLGEDIEIDVNMPILDAGMSSVELIRLKRAAEEAFDINDIPMLVILTHATIGFLAEAIHGLQGSGADSHYRAVVTLQPHGSKTPLWLFHPGVGEILIFLGLAQYFPDRPVHAFRPRGFNPREVPFANQDELLDVYYDGLRQKQPHGPYALVGYSYGTVLAFELSKRLEAEGETVQLLASFNLPPHIKERMRTLDWTAGLTHICYFCDIISQERAHELNTELRGRPQDEQISLVLEEADPARTVELGLTKSSLHTWVNVAFSLQKIGWEYDPSGNVSCMDVFFCHPLKDVASSREEYRYEKLNHWADFVRDDLQFHEVGGEHYTMIGPDHLPKFQQTLKRVMAARGV